MSPDETREHVLATCALILRAKQQLDTAHSTPYDAERMEELVLVCGHLLNIVQNLVGIIVSGQPFEGISEPKKGA